MVDQSQEGNTRGTHGVSAVVNQGEMEGKNHNNNSIKFVTLVANIIDPVKFFVFVLYRGC